MDNPFKKPSRRPEPIPIPDESVHDKGGEVIIRARYPSPDERALGWAKSVDEETGKEVRELKGISIEDREAHFYIVGASRTGKTKFLEYLMVQDWEKRSGFAVIDPHGDLVDDLKDRLLVGRGKAFLEKWVVLIDPTDKERTVSFNPLEITGNESTASIALELTGVFKKIWGDSWGARMEDLLKNTLIALIENGLTLAELPLFLTNLNVRRKILSRVEHEGCRDYFEHRFNELKRGGQDERMESTLNKVDAFLFDPALRQMLASPKSSFHLRDIMDNGKILLVKLDKGQLKGSADLLGSLMLAKIQMAAFTRTDTPKEERRPFHLYIDEFQNFATESFLAVLAESLKYKLSLTLAHQHLAQLPSNLRAAILSNCDIQAYFRISRDDANILAKESLSSVYNDPPGWEWYIQQLQELPNRGFVVKNKNGGGVLALRTAELKELEDLRQEVKKLGAKEGVMESIGKESLRSRKEIENEYKARRDMLTRNDEPESFREPKRLL